MMPLKLLSKRKMMMVVFLWTVMCAIMRPVLTEPDIADGCLDKCSDEVECKVEKWNCRYDTTPSKSVASKLTNLRVNPTEDEHYKYFNLNWTPPDDGSFRDLKAFGVHVGFTSHDHNHAGQRAPQCYRVNIVDPDWIKKYSNTSVKFYLRCIRLSLADYMTLRISIYSLPLNTDRPKMVTKEILYQPDKWDPDIQKFVDKQNRMHIRIHNPHPQAMFYKVTLFSSKRRTLFKRVLPAQHIPMKNEEDGMTQEDDEHLPHYVIKRVPTNTTSMYIRLSPLYANKSEIPGATIFTRPFTLKFPKDSQQQSPSPSVSIVPETKSDVGLSGQLVTIILVIALVLLVLLGLAMWKTLCQSAACKFLVPSISNNIRDRPKILPIYCDENEDFVRAVESHVSLLQRYVNVLPVPDQIKPRSGWCPLTRRTRLWVNSELKVTDVIIYLSPGLGQLTSWGQVQSLSRLDHLCHQTLQSLQQHQASHHDTFTTHIVTFDCFQNDELQCLPMLGSMFTRREIPNAIQDGTSSTPLRIANFRQNSWKLENLEQLLFQICQAREFPQDLPSGVQGWRDSLEAKQVELYLARFGIHVSSNICDSANGVVNSEEDPDSVCLDVGCENETEKLVVDMDKNDEKCCATSQGAHSPKFSQEEEQEELGCKSEESSGFYSAAQGTFYTEVPSLSACPETMVVDLNNIHSSCVRYTKPDDNPHKQSYSSRVSNNWHAQQDSNRVYIRPPPLLSLGQDNQNTTTNTPCLAESDSDNNEYVSSSLESDTLLTKDDNNDREYSFRANFKNAISPPSSLVYNPYKDSISDLISQANNTSGWNSSTYI